MHIADSILETAEIAFRLPEPPPSRWHRAGVSARGERIFDVISGLVLSLLAAGWTWSIVDARTTGEDAGGTTPATAAVASALTRLDAPSAAYLTDAALQLLTPLRGESGRLRATFQVRGKLVVRDTLADTLPTGARIEYSASGARAESTSVGRAPSTPGVWGVAIAAGGVVRSVTDFSVIAMLPFEEKSKGRIGTYRVGSWPGERSPRSARYALPSGFIEVTPENENTPVSDHFRLRDFLTHDQQGVWPKYLVLEERLIDKLELVLADLETRGYRTAGVRVMSGFRTPQYNATGGNTAGRAALSRHMYGDASDIFIDNDGNGVMDDLNGDGRITIRDAEVILASVERVEREHPAVIGGAGTYPAGPGHGPFIHIDTRGFRARWIGSGDGQ